MFIRDAVGTLRKMTAVPLRTRASLSEAVIFVRGYVMRTVYEWEKGMKMEEEKEKEVLV